MGRCLEFRAVGPTELHDMAVAAAGNGEALQQLRDVVAAQHRGQRLVRPPLALPSERPAPCLIKKEARRRNVGDDHRKGQQFVKRFGKIPR